MAQSAPRSVSVGVGIIGLGFGRRVHAPAFASLVDLEVAVVAVCDRSGLGAPGVAEQLGARATAGWRELVEDDAVEVVSVAVPPAAQPEIVEQALGLGKAVFCEKPLAVDVAGAAAIVAAARTSPAPAIVDFEFREVDAFGAAKREIVAGAVGTVDRIEVTWHTAGRAFAQRHSVNWKDGVGGGASGVLAPHVLDYLQWLAAPVEELNASCAGSPASPDSLQLTAQLTGGASAGVDLSVVAREPVHRVLIGGSEGSLLIEQSPGAGDHVHGLSLTRVAPGGSELLVEARREDQDGRIAPVARLARRLVEARIAGVAPEPSVADGLAVQRALAAVEQSVAARGPIRVVH